MNFRISVIIPVYNVELYIKECIESVMNQTMAESVECIIIDDCGQDNSIKIVEKLISKYTGLIHFSIIQHEHNAGLSSARNTGIRAAKGQYLFFLDSDDAIIPSTLELMWALVQKYPNVHLVQGSCSCKLQFFDLNNLQFPEYSDNPKWIQAHMLNDEGFPVSAWNKLVKRDLILKSSCLFKEGIIHEDNHWTFFLANCVKSIAFCFMNTYIYRENPLGIMNSEVHSIKEIDSYKTIALDCYNSLGWEHCLRKKIYFISRMLSNILEYEKIPELSHLFYFLSYAGKMREEYKLFSIKGIYYRILYRCLPGILCLLVLLRK